MECRKLLTAEQALKLVKSGDRIMVGGFGNVGVPWGLIDALLRTDASGLTIISNDLGDPNVGLGKLLCDGRIKKLVGTYYTWNPDVAEAYNAKKIDVELVPQGTFAEAIRAGGVGTAGFYTKTSAGTDIARGKETRVFDGQEYVFAKAIRADIALIKAYKSDPLGNLVYYKTARNFNPVMAMAAKIVIAEVDEITPSIDPETVVTPHLFVKAVTLKG